MLARLGTSCSRDLHGSIRAAALAMGGDWHDLGEALLEAGNEPVALQPLARVDQPGERAWMALWIATLLRHESVTVTPELKEHQRRRNIVHEAGRIRVSDLPIGLTPRLVLLLGRANLSTAVSARTVN